MREERLQEIKDSVDFQREMLLARNLGTLCVDEEQELIDEIERLKEEYMILQNASDEVEEEKDKEIERLNSIIKEQDKELELERKSRQLLTDDLANVCKISLKKDNIIKEVREYIETINKNRKGLSVIEYHNKFCELYDYYESGIIMQDILEILDKEEK